MEGFLTIPQFGQKPIKQTRMKRIIQLLIFVLTIYPMVLSSTYAQDNGTIFGKVVDSATGEELIGANIFLDGTTIGAATDIEGNFKISTVSAGTYTLIASMIGYSKFTVTDLEIKPGEQKKLDLSLVSEAYQTEEVVITARMILDNDAALLKNRQKSIAVSDAIGSDMIKQSGSDNAGDALKKVVGTSVVDGKYVFVRGLGDRYSSTQLNGAELPSTDPNRKSFQMDLIPSNLLDNIVTLKTFTPDKPGNFSGGIVDIGTKSFPEKFTLKLSGGTSYNSQTTGNAEFLTYQGGNTDWLGIDDGTRGLPEIFNDPNLKIPTEQGARFDAQQAATLDEVSNSFNNIMDVSRGTVPVNSNLAMSVGDNIQLGETSKFGYMASITYRRDYNFYEGGEVGRYILSDIGSEELNPLLLLNDSKGVSEANWGGLITAALNINPEQQISGNYFYSRSGISTTRYMFGKWPQEFGQGEDTPDYTNRVLHWMERDIASYQLRGDHLLSGLLNTHADWSASFSETKQDEPDFRLVTSYTKIRPQDTTYTISGSNFDDPSRYFRTLNDNNKTFNANFSVPFAQWNGYLSKFKFGGYFQSSDRNFNETIITYSPKNAIYNQVDGELALLFDNGNNGIIDSTVIGGTTRYTFGNTVYDRSFLKNNYTGDQSIYAAYGMFELPIFIDLKFVGGVRFETTDLSVLSLDPNIPEGKIEEQDFLPSVSFIYNLTDQMNLRIAGTQTLARPTFREIAPFSSKEFVNDIELSGNPNLQRTLIENYDVRWEWFLRPGEILAVSAFYKNLKNPIEIAFVEGSTRSNPIVNYTNVDQAVLMGLEFEARLGLSYLIEQLNNFSVGLNLALVSSTVDIAPSELAQRKAIDPNSSDTRQLQGQSPYVLNVDVS
ncbi:MAG TPA: TonB-dependent receptor, partial [Ignavibacteriaceae bacterium]|nr:TonB-dependent receptor [Ignavibacteriaceae bacterium]